MSFSKEAWQQAKDTEYEYRPEQSVPTECSDNDGHSETISTDTGLVR